MDNSYKSLIRKGNGGTPVSKRLAVIPELCSGCGLCIPACPYDARAMHEWRHIATVNTALCQGCAACATVCPNKACQVRNLTNQQVLSMVEAYL